MAIAVKSMECSWSMIDIIRVLVLVLVLSVGRVSDISVKAAAVAVRGERSVTIPGIHIGSGRDKEDARDQANLWILVGVYGVQGR